MSYKDWFINKFQASEQEFKEQSHENRDFRYQIYLQRKNMKLDDKIPEPSSLSWLFSIDSLKAHGIDFTFDSLPHPELSTTIHHPKEHIDLPPLSDYSSRSESTPFTEAILENLSFSTPKTYSEIPSMRSNTCESDFQILYEKFCFTHQALQIRNDELSRMTKRFLRWVEKVGVILCSELYLDPEKQKFKKTEDPELIFKYYYIVDNVIFRIAHDTKTTKILKNEIRTRIQLIKSRVAGLTTPLSCVISITGFTISASPIVDYSIPFSLSTTCEEVDYNLERLGEKFNLASHSVQGVKVSTSLYLEKRIGINTGRVYLTKLRNLFPLLPPNHIITKDYPFLRFRPEFLTLYCNKTPISSDVFTPVSSPEDDENANRLFNEKLLETAINKLASDIDALAKVHENKMGQWVDLSTIFHNEGINMKFLGVVFNTVTSSVSKMVLFEEMIFRALKVTLFSLFRQAKGKKDGISKFFLQAILQEDSKFYSLLYKDHLPNYIKTYFFGNEEYSDDISFTTRINNFHSKIIGTRTFASTLFTRIGFRWGKISIGEFINLIKSDNLPGLKLTINESKMNISSIRTFHEYHQELQKLKVIIENELSPNSVRLLPIYYRIIQIILLFSNYSSDSDMFKIGEESVKNVIRIASKNSSTDSFPYFMATVFYSAFDDKIAINHCETLVKMLTKKGNNVLKARALLIQGKLYSNMKKFSLADPCFTKALAIRESHFGTDHPIFATACIRLGSFYRKNNEYDKAEYNIARALKILEAKMGDESIHIATICNELGDIYRKKSNFIKAEQLFLRALDLFERESGGSETPACSRVVEDLAVLYKHQDMKEKSVACFQRALRIYEKNNNTAAQVRILLNLAKIDKKEEKYNDALRLYQRIIILKPLKKQLMQAYNHIIKIHNILGNKELENDYQQKHDSLLKQDASKSRSPKRNKTKSPSRKMNENYESSKCKIL